MDQQSDSGSVTATPRSTKEKVGANNTIADMEPELSSKLSDVFNVSTLNPDNSPEKPQMLTRGQLEKARNTKPIEKVPPKPVKKALVQLAKKPVSKKGKKKIVEEVIVSFPLQNFIAKAEQDANHEGTALQRALDTLEYEEDPPGRPE
jgi:hypothetical protein